MTHMAITHAAARTDARINRAQEWADHQDAPTTSWYNYRCGLLDNSLGYVLAEALAYGLDSGAD
ncbi:hypothetical protein ACH4D3_00880 [Streptomyces sp. NPDC018026]|uniref:hypothetical protein n=1 Tax=Streptomyces sp. NPDC018026 TaxID=3365031 RepID=UPI00379DDC76